YQEHQRYYQYKMVPLLGVRCVTLSSQPTGVAAACNSQRRRRFTWRVVFANVLYTTTTQEFARQTPVSSLNEKERYVSCRTWLSIHNAGRLSVEHGNPDSSGRALLSGYRDRAP